MKSTLKIINEFFYHLYRVKKLPPNEEEKVPQLIARVVCLSKCVTFFSDFKTRPTSYQMNTNIAPPTPTATHY